MMILKVYASGGGRGRTGGGGGGGTVNTPAPNGPVRIRGTFGRGDDERRRIRGTTQGNYNPNRQGMSAGRYGPMI